MYNCERGWNVRYFIELDFGAPLFFTTGTAEEANDPDIRTWRGTIEEVDSSEETAKF